VPHRLPYPVLVNFGAPLPADARTWRVRQAVQELLADCFELRREDQKPPHREFVRIACRHPARPCLIDPNPGGWRLNYGMTLTAAIALTRRLRRLLEPGDKAALLVPTSVGGALANIAVALLGRTAVNLNYTASQEAMRSALQQCHLRQVITARAFVEKIKPDLGPGVSFLYLEDLVKQVGRLERALTFLSVLFLPGVIMEYVILGLGRHSVDALATIIFSSGSTGDPKGVMLSHHNILSNVQSVCQAIDPLPPDRLLGVLPFFHSFGYMACLWLPLVIGASAVLYPDPRQAKEIGEFCHRFKCTLFISTPTFLRFFLRRSDPDDFRTLRLLITGAEKLPQALAREFARKFGVPPLEGYGTTELSPVVSFNVPDWDKGDFKQVGHKPGTIGQPVPGVAVKVVDVDTGAQLPPGAVGLLCVKGPNVMVGYLDRPEATAEAIRDGWYVTGDLARLDEDGFITITDRLSRFSKIAGEMVPHQRVEEEIHHLLGTSERVCVVTGLPDEKKGERLVVLYTDLHGHLPAAVAQQLAASGLPNLWLPDARSFYQVAELPILGSGKLDLQRVKRLAHEKSGR
jgi:acyl-[acyl-carrier-protein]-phospholipid O-acyltransferase/long-chain-fatty-acid--[acyl-carrier-protein] ligase